ncbi:hypothetical protein JRQ81_010137 [Phrynocephalus forsythii]|uniref:Uncharacterized protein n=1 Tax=Phrynocephalus forsythii TaxID=171643 RepID=A0A9Q1ARL0_9SAUR|nr:hypothetical protein JRQ81_010137 [Phrynocephalus forsythii]
MEEVWAVYLCLFLFVIVLLLLRKKPDDDIIIQKETSSAYSMPSTSYSSGSLGKRLDYTEEELEASLRRLSGVLFGTEAHKREPHPEHKSSSPQNKLCKRPWTLMSL